jgi:2-polyprenyl-3-methyl-5-hydroxy-6-metoxy-1,4-benzoquinol methylase
MPISRTDLIEFNRGQDYSEEDNFTSERYVQFLRHFPKDARDVLDIGCNTGRGGQILKLQNPHLRIVGLDCVPDRLEKVPSNVFERTICGFADDIALESGSFDVIVAGEFIEHVPIVAFERACSFDHPQPSLHQESFTQPKRSIG